MLKRLESSVLLVLAACLVFILSCPARADSAPDIKAKAEIDAVNSAIKKSGGKWVAGKTSLSELSLEDRKRRVGIKDMSDIAAEPLDEKLLSSLSLPATVDWRDNNGNFVTPIRDQQQCGSCWAFALTAGLEAHVLLSQQTPGKDVALSEQILVSCDHDGGDDGCNGGTMDASFLVNNGLPLASAFPYTSGQGDSGTCPANWSDKTTLYKAGKWAKVRKNLRSIKSALNRFGPLPTTFLVYEDFMHYKSGIYSYSGQGQMLGGHAVLLVGYNDDGQYFIVKNSWGTDWGENGYFRIAYSEMKTAVAFGQNTIAYPSDGGNGIAKKHHHHWPFAAPSLNELKGDAVPTAQNP